MSDQEAARAHQIQFLEELKSRREPYIVTVQGVDIVVNPNVFPPVTDSQLLAAYIKIKPGDSILDLTTGSGVFAVLAGLQGATGIAVDLHPDAVKNANDNFRRFGVDIEAIQSDLFQEVPKEEFDWIFANGPYAEGEVTHPLQLAFYGARSFQEKVFSQAPNYLKPEGKILITFAEWGDVEQFERLAGKNGFNFKVIDKKSSGNQRVYRLYEMRLAK